MPLLFLECSQHCHRAIPTMWWMRDVLINAKHRKVPGGQGEWEGWGDRLQDWNNF